MSLAVFAARLISRRRSSVDRVAGRAKDLGGEVWNQSRKINCLSVYKEEDSLPNVLVCRRLHTVILHTPF